MKGEAVREFFGVWTPFLVAVLILIIATRFLLLPPPPGENLATKGFPQGYEATWYLCGFGLFGLGGLLMFSTLGRYRKARAARSEPPGAPVADSGEDGLK